mmetsp:Transcript_17749/g.51853  ORF Transcript_17749/g.51853 Transcript_17749/m.51853 type:complete len:95 (+) Transcript_17749:1-285(+)
MAMEPMRTARPWKPAHAQERSQHYAYVERRRLEVQEVSGPAQSPAPSEGPSGEAEPGHGTALSSVEVKNRASPNNEEVETHQAQAEGAAAAGLG